MARRRIAIVGSRDYPRPDLVEAFVARLPKSAVVVSGGARGVDSVAVEAAEARGLEAVVFPADWRRWRRSAGPRRNAEIVEHADRVVAFWDGASRGTLDTVRRARRAGLPIEIYDAGGAALPVEVALAVLSI